MDLGSVLERAVAELEPGGRLVEMRELTGGVSATVLGLEIATPAGGTRRVVFRQHRSSDFKHHAQRVTAMEYAVLAALYREGFAVPEPFCYDDTDAVTAPFLIIDWVDGATDVSERDLPGALDQMAQFLVALHSCDPTSLGIPEIEPVEDPRAAVIPYLPRTEVGEKVSAAVTSGAVTPTLNPSVLLHGDYWPGNVMWEDGRLVAVIDWEDARLGDPLADLAAARVELLCRYDGDAMEQFTTRYLAGAHDTMRPLRLDSLPLWELYVSAAALATMGQWGLEPAEEARRRRRTAHFFDRAARDLG